MTRAVPKCVCGRGGGGGYIRQLEGRGGYVKPETPNHVPKEDRILPRKRARE